MFKTSSGVYYVVLQYFQKIYATLIYTFIVFCCKNKSTKDFKVQFRFHKNHETCYIFVIRLQIF